MLTEEVMPLIVVSRAQNTIKDFFYNTIKEMIMEGKLVQKFLCLCQCLFACIIYILQKEKPITKFRIIQLGKRKLNYNSHKYFRLSHQFN